MFTRLGKNYTAVELGREPSGRRELTETSFISHIFTDFLFSLLVVAKYLSSCEKLRLQITLECASFTLCDNSKLQPSVRLKMSSYLSLVQAASKSSDLENSSCVTVRCSKPVSLHAGTDDWVLLSTMDHMIISAYFSCLALQLLAAISPL